MTSRSRRTDSAPALSRAVYKNQFGTVRVYTRRHINGCLFTDPDQQHCQCPKWIYSKARGGRHAVKSANTPSFTEACGIAQKILRGFDPEIAFSRKEAAPGPTIEEIIERYLAVVASRGVKSHYLHSIGAQFRRRRVCRKGVVALNSSLLDFLDRANATAADPVVRMEQISSNLLDDWAASWRANDLTNKLRRTLANSFFRWAVGRRYLDRMPVFGERQRVRKGNRCGYFTDEQYSKLLAALSFIGPNHVERLRAFLDCGRWAGMAVADIVRFSPRTNLGANNVLTYRRTKNAEIAAILLDPEVAQRLRSIPAESGSSADQPFRFPLLNERTNRSRWRDRFQALCRKAGITAVETEIGTVRAPHPHMLRDTFAIDAITRGVHLENVAKMLGHASSQMTQKAYLFWVKKRLDYCIEDQRAGLARRAGDVAAAANAGGAENAGTSLPPLIH
jgi:integrase